EVVATLSRASILISQERFRARGEDFQRTVRDAASKFRAFRYVTLRDLIHPFQLAALRRYYRELIAEGYLPFGDGQVERRYVAHNEPLARYMHRRLTPLVNGLAGLAMKPSYVYSASYRPGAVLLPHRDREQCEVSI